ncbi:hypothetical protein JZ751_002286 [Albula glossodonta]|uniref:Uncharacterized protein n=1 Tax=Albula glossodonta TaxID=121402 RepID=A0A8T2P9D9_9TELE|nr:hypothetical protein JZ751_002286 [Albula glossodonta]
MSLAGEKKRVTSSGDRRKRLGKLSPLPQNYSCPSELSSTGSPESYSSPSSSPPYSHSSVLTDSQGGYHSDEADERFSCPLSQAPCSPCSPEYQAPSPPESIVCSPQSLWEAGGEDQGPQELGHCRNGMSFFWFQLQREENVLSGISDKELLTADSSGRIPLHSMVNQGKGATVYSIAKRMAAMGQLDIKDAEGKTALHLAAQRNQHLMVSDLLLLGAGINERDKFGKTCLHLSAENGYVRVVEYYESQTMWDAFSHESSSYADKVASVPQCKVIV